MYLPILSRSFPIVSTRTASGGDTGTVTVGNSLVTVSANSDWVGAFGVETFLNTDVSIKVGADYAAQCVFGLEKAGVGRIVLRNDWGVNGYVLQTWDGGGSQQSGVLFSNLTAGDRFDFTWSAGVATVSRDGSLLATNTNYVPAAPLAFVLGSGWQTPALSFDYVALGTGAIPEPSAMILLLTGLLGLFGYAWRKRK
jgi:hypothetical protein